MFSNPTAIKGIEAHPHPLYEIVCFDWNRCTASQALQSSYFSNHPAPTPGPKLPMPRSKKEVEREMEYLVSAARKRALDEEEPTAKIAKRLQF